MSIGSENSADGSAAVDVTAAEDVTALVSRRDAQRARLAERQQALIDRLHRGLQAVSTSYPQLNAVWLELRGNWSSLVVVPGEPDCSTAELARGLANTGARLCVHPVEFTDATKLDLATSTRLVAQFGAFDDPASTALAQDGTGAGPLFDGHGQTATKSVVALESPLANPLALPVALAADGVVLCVRRGRDRIAAVRDTIRAIGAERIVCCVLVE